MPSLAGPDTDTDTDTDCDVPVVIHGRRAFAQRRVGSIGNLIFADLTGADCEGPAGPDACDLLAAELGVRDAVGQRARTDAYHRRDAVRAALHLPNR